MNYNVTAIISPLVYNAYLNSQEYGTFTCIARNGDATRWIIDGFTDTVPYIRDTQLITVVPTELNTNCNNSQHSTLVIPAIPVNRHIAHIKCRAYITYGAFQQVESVETAQFNIQGLLNAPSNITFTSYNTTHNLIEWQEPETLDITNIEPDIENYTVCTNITGECVNTTTPYFILPKFFLDLQVNITAWNIVGESNSSAQLYIPTCNKEVAIGITFKF